MPFLDGDMHGIDEVAEGVAQEGPDQKHRHRLHDGHFRHGFHRQHHHLHLSIFQVEILLATLQVFLEPRVFFHVHVSIFTRLLAHDHVPAFPGTFGEHLPITEIRIRLSSSFHPRTQLHQLTADSLDGITGVRVALELKVLGQAVLVQAQQQLAIFLLQLQLSMGHHEAIPPLEGSVTSATAAIFVGIAQVHEEVHRAVDLPRVFTFGVSVASNALDNLTDSTTAE
mmetsp:Transcript_65953/g.144649  ORF Transcript_65953/g.144649 Transcript_65953/m.144649 type:complete len:226 (-) Transcript_65953:1310-1987(-)